MKLYEIANQYNNIAELLENPDFEGNTDIIEALDQIQDEFDKKAVQVVYGIKNTEAEIDMIDSEIKRLQEMKKYRKNRIDQIKAYLKHNMQQTGTSKITCPYFNITYSERSQSVVEIDEALIDYTELPPECYKVEIKPNKDEIKRLLKAGEVIIGAKLTGSQVLKIS